MPTQITVYTFSELSEKAKENAINEAINKGLTSDCGAYSEINYSVKAVLDLFNLKTGRTYSDIRTGHISDEILNLKGIRAYKYILNSYGDSLFKPCYIKHIDGRHVTGRQFIYKHRNYIKSGICTAVYSKLRKDDTCTLTGVCYDMDILQPIYDFLKCPDKHTTVGDLFNDIGDAIAKCYRDEEENINSAEYIVEFLEANGYEFTEHGKMI